MLAALRLPAASDALAGKAAAPKSDDGLAGLSEAEQLQLRAAQLEEHCRILEQLLEVSGWPSLHPLRQQLATGDQRSGRAATQALLLQQGLCSMVAPPARLLQEKTSEVARLREENARQAQELQQLRRQQQQQQQPRGPRREPAATPPPAKPLARSGSSGSSAKPSQQLAVDVRAPGSSEPQGSMWVAFGGSGGLDDAPTPTIVRPAGSGKQLQSFPLTSPLDQPTPGAAASPLTPLDELLGSGLDLGSGPAAGVAPPPRQPQQQTPPPANGAALGGRKGSGRLIGLAGSGLEAGPGSGGWDRQLPFQEFNPLSGESEAPRPLRHKVGAGRRAGAPLCFAAGADGRPAPLALHSILVPTQPAASLTLARALPAGPRLVGRALRPRLGAALPRQTALRPAPGQRRLLGQPGRCARRQLADQGPAQRRRPRAAGLVAHQSRRRRRAGAPPPPEREQRVAAPLWGFESLLGLAFISICSLHSLLGCVVFWPCKRCRPAGQA